jgi:ABC-type Fe3+/spermidine/putrescine transport system ATPase subunit
MTQSTAQQAVGLSVRDLVAGYAGTRVVSGVSFEVEPSEFVTLLGPSGCGKTTTLRCVAGLHPVLAGTVAVDGEVLSSARVHLRPERRRINMVFQSYAIWPHMTVFDNVAYGMKGRRRDHTAQVRALLDLVGLSDFADRGASGLSGGQQQRVALARALATGPRVLLLDEPLSNLDAVLRSRMRSEIMRIQRETGTTTLYVTHDRREALSMSDRIVIMRDGLIEQSGTPEQLYDHPVSRFVAEFLAFANVVPAKVTEAGPGGIRVRAYELQDAPELAIDRAGHETCPSPGDEVQVVIRPDSLRPAAPGDTNVIAGRLLTREFLGNRSEVTVRSGAHLVKAEFDRLASADGDENLTLHAPPTALTWVPASRAA